MNDKSIERTLRAIRKNASFGVPLDFQGRCVQAWPAYETEYEVKAGCYTDIEGLPEYESLCATGAIVKTSAMGNKDEFITFSATLTESQMRMYLTVADGADVEP